MLVAPMNVLPAYGIDDLIKVTESKLDNGVLKNLLGYAQRHDADGKLRRKGVPEIHFTLLELC